MNENRDKYLGFKYKEKSLGMTYDATFYGFVENEGNDLTFSNFPETSNEFSNPIFSEKTYYLGNTKNHRNFSLKIQLDKILLRKYREFLDWLNFDDIGLLVFDYNPWYGYKVKVDSITDSEFYVVKDNSNNEDFYYINLTVNFITVGDFAATWIKENVAWTGNVNDNLIDNDFFRPFLKEETNNIFTFYNNHNIKNYFTIDFNETLLIEELINDNPITWSTVVNITNAGPNVKFFSEFGIAVSASGNFIPYDKISKIWISSNSQKTFRITSEDGSLVKIKPSSREVL